MEKKREKKGKKLKKFVWSYCMKKIFEYVEVLEYSRLGFCWGNRVLGKFFF